MERPKQHRRNTLALIAVSAAALSACTVKIESYLTDTSNVRCDDRRTRSDLEGNGMATFIVHGKQKDDLATVQVRRSHEGVSVGVTGDISGPPQQFENDGFTIPKPLVDGPELSAFAAGAAWVIDVRKDSVVIQGSCEGM